MTVNILAHNSDLESIEKYLLELSKSGVDGIIVADPGILEMAGKLIPHIPLHLSTQANVTNVAAANFWLKQGAVRLNLARELSLEEITTICADVGGEIEVFVHGSLCISYSGRCMLSIYLTARDANRGNCSHPCRFSYALLEEKRPGEYFPIEEDERGTYIFNAKDLCLLQVLPELIAAGVDSLKIEGRMKSIFYVGGVVRVYRAVLDYLAELPESAWQNPKEIEIPPHFYQEIQNTGTRGISENFVREKPGFEEMLYETSRAEQLMEPVAVVRESGKIPVVEIRNRVKTGEEIEYMGKGFSGQKVTIQAMHQLSGQKVEVANPGNSIVLHTLPELKDCQVHGIIRRNKAGSA